MTASNPSTGAPHEEEDPRDPGDDAMGQPPGPVWDPAEEGLYRSDTLQVLTTIADEAAFRRHGCELVTFEPFRRVYTREPFGKRFARKYGINALHIVPTGSDWYQYPDIDACLAAVADATAPGATLYGSSMGGYAAAAYADRLPVSKVIALSPQYSIRRDLVPFETRWAAEAATITFQPQDGKVAQNCHLYLFYDPKNPDARHAQMIAERARHVTMVEVPGGGHPVGPVLVEAGCLSMLIMATLRGTPEQAELDAIIQEHVAKSPQHHLNLAIHAPLAKREPHLRAGLAIDPRHPKLRHNLALWLAATGRLGEALPHFEYAVRRRPLHPAYRRHYMEACRKAKIAPAADLLTAADGSPA